MRKFIFSFLICVLLISFFAVTGHARTEAGIDLSSGNVIIEGAVAAERVNEKGISVLLKKKNASATDPDFVGYVNQLAIEEDGSYFCKFKFTKDIKDYELLVFNGDTLATDTVRTAQYTRRHFTEAALTFREDASTVELNAQLINDPYVDAFSCVAVIAGYTDGRLVSAVPSTTAVFCYDAVQKVVVTAEIPAGAETVKGFVWSSLTEAIPLWETEVMDDREPFLAYSWSLPQTGAENVYPMFYLYDRETQTRPEDTDKTTSAYMLEGQYEAAAQAMKRFMLSRPPEGRIAICHLSKTIYDPQDTGRGCFDNWFWWDEGIDMVITELTTLLNEYEKIGGPDLTALFWDFEAGCDNSNMIWDYIGVKPTYDDSGAVIDNGRLSAEELNARYQAVVDDPRYLTDIRPALEALGFEFYEGNDHSELYYYHSLVSGHRESYYIGQIFAKQRKAQYLNKIYEAVKNYYPNIIFSNYGDYYSIPADEPLEAENASWHEAIPEVSERAASPLGTHGSPVLYGKMSDSLRVPAYAYGNTVPKTPFTGALAMLQKMQRVTAYSEEQCVMPWVGNRTWDYSDQIPYASTEYYKELILHLGLCNARAFLYFNNASRSEGWAQDDVLFSGLMEELNEVAGFSGRHSVTTTPVSANVRYMLSGMEAGGRNIWRITPDIYTPDGADGYVTKDSFLIDAEAPAFRIGNQLITFPEGSYIYTAANEQSSIGYWVVSPVGTSPVESTVEDLEAPPAADYVFVADAEYEKLKAEYGITE